MPDTPATGQRLLEEGLHLQSQGRDAEAAARFERAVALDPTDHGVRALFAHALLRTKRLNRARREFDRLVEAVPHNAALRTSLGAVLQQQGRLEEAIEEFRRAAASDPSLTEAHTGLGIALLRASRPREARDALMVACRLQPGNAIALAATGDACRDLARFEEAIDWYRGALATEPGMVEAGMNLGQILLLLGRYEEGWAILERARMPAELATARARFPFPTWTGEDVAGKTVLVWFDQGIGDQVMYAGCLDDLIARGARCAITCDARLERLFGRSWPDAEVLAGGGIAALRNADFQVSAEGLARILRPRRDRFPLHAGYLTPESAARPEVRSRLATLGEGLKIGISWRGGTARTRRAQRTIPLPDLAPLLAVPGTRFVSLQYDEAGGEIGGLEDPVAAGIAHWPEFNQDPDRAAALIAELDLVISVPTTAVHLAGALGKPVWILTPFSPDWRYLADGETMPWYPSARVLRQHEPGNWHVPLAVAAERLGRLGTDRRRQS